MSNRSRIEWTDVTWNPVRGCTRVSEGCRNCYAERMAERFSGPGQPFEGFARRGPGYTKRDGVTPSGPHWTGRVELVAEKLAEPLRWAKPRRVFVNSMSDLFHDELSDEAIDRVFAVMALCPQHTFQVLTKRPERMRAYMTTEDVLYRLAHTPIPGTAPYGFGHNVSIKMWPTWPLPNVWLGVSVEDQDTADERVPLLLETPAAVRFVSYEPALGPVNLERIDGGALGAEFSGITISAFNGGCETDTPWGINWVICGGESGPGARAAHPDWFRSVRDQCAAAGVAYFFKQWGEWAPSVPAEAMADYACTEADTEDLKDNAARCVVLESDGTTTYGRALGTRDFWCGADFGEDSMIMRRVGKRAAGRVLDGRTHDAFPVGA